MHGVPCLRLRNPSRRLEIDFPLLRRLDPIAILRVGDLGVGQGSNQLDLVRLVL